MRIKCLVIDDEPPARELLTNYIARLENLQLEAQCANALEAYEILQVQEIDLIFLDIKMPELSGLDFIKTLHHRPKIVITTAYREYAVEGFELDVLDYLVKPISFERFLKALSKYNQQAALPNPSAGIPEADQPIDGMYMYFKVNREMVRIYLRDILYIESIKDYIKIITPQKTYVTHERISFMEEKLPEKCFIRVHKSYIVSLQKISSFGGDLMKIDSHSIPVGRHFKRKVQEVVKEVLFQNK